MKFQFILENGEKQEVAVTEEARIYRAILCVKDGEQIAIRIPESIQRIYIRE